MDLDVGEFLDSLQLNNLKDIFEKEQASRMKGHQNTVFKTLPRSRHVKNEQQEVGGDIACARLSDSIVGTY